MDPLIISAALSGDTATPEQNPNLPITPEAVGEAAALCADAGATIVHIHARDAHGAATMDLVRCREFFEAVRSRLGGRALINLTSAGSWDASEDERVAVVGLRPDLVSLDAGSMNFGEHVFVNSPGFLERLARMAQEAGVKPEAEVFDLGQLYNVLRLAEHGWLDPPLWVQFVLGVPGGAPAELRHLVHLVAALPEGSLWSVVGLARYQLPLTTAATIMGGHVRVGLEDNLYLRRGALASNPQLVERAARLAGELQRPLATVVQARALLGLAAG
jgi:3-keto-5-aminohexanoate cleavage enzyme